MASSKRPSIFKGRTVAFITGASRGIGRAIAVEFAKRFKNELHLVLTGRSCGGLQETCSLIRSDSNYSPERATVRIVLGDLENQGEFPSLLDRLFGDIDSTEYQHAILVSNAGSAGDMTKFVRDFSSSDSSKIQDHLFLNVTATFLMTSRFLTVFSSSRDAGNDTEGSIRRTVVQISAGGSVRGLAAWSLYSTSKAARDILHKVIAAEEPGVRVLSYAPGPVDTALMRHVREHCASPSTTELITRMQKIMVSPERAAGVLCDVLEEDEYESGSRVTLSEFTKSHGGK